jgi:hypothetical protein
MPSRVLAHKVALGFMPYSDELEKRKESTGRNNYANYTRPKLEQP